VLADTSADFHPREFRYSNWGCEMRLRFPAVKLLALARRQQRLERSPNPFAEECAANRCENCHAPQSVCGYLHRR